MTKKKFFSIVAEGLCWLIFWLAAFGIGKTLWSWGSAYLPHIHFYITWGDSHRDDGADSTLEKWIKKNLPKDKQADGTAVYKDILKKIEAGQLLGYLDTRSELLSLAEAVSSEWLNFSKELLDKLNRDKFIEEFKGAAGVIVPAEVRLLAVESLKSQGGTKNADNTEVAVGATQQDTEKDSTDNTAVVSDCKDKGESDNGGKGGTGEGKTADKPAKKDKSKDKASSGTQNGYGWY